MDQPGGWLSSDPPSPELEARWGPTASGVSPAVDAAAVVDAEPVWQPLLAPAAPARRGSLRAVALVGAAIVVVAAALGGALTIARGGEARETAVVSASAGSDSGDTVELTESAKAFLERWNAGPSTTMPLGAAGVPLHERPTTTTDTTTTTRVVTSKPSPRSAPTTARSFYEPDEEKPSPPKLAADDPRLRGAEARAHDFVDAMVARDCDALWATFSTRTLEFFAEMDAASEDGTTMKDEMCASLREEELPEKITVHAPARPHRDGAVVDLEAEGEIEPLTLLLEGDRWTVDLFGDYYDE